MDEVEPRPTPDKLGGGLTIFSLEKENHFVYSSAENSQVHFNNLDTLYLDTSFTQNAQTYYSECMKDSEQKEEILLAETEHYGPPSFCVN